MFERWRKGERKPVMPTETWNQFCDIGQRVNAALGPASGSGGFSSLGHAVDVDIKNVSGGDLTSAFPILRLTEPIFTPTDDAAVHRKGVKFKANTPNDSTKHNFVVVQGPVASNAIRSAVIQGATWCKVDVESEDHTHATSEDGNNATLVSGGAGARILWKQSGTGEKWAVILIGGGGSSMNVIHGLATGSVSGGTFNADNIELINGVDPRSDTSSTTETVEILNPFGFDIANNGKIRAEQADDGDWICVQAECP